jgi:2-C-methyl-D-erythritol 4-phosphate cytidylyltransferase/2-C-methyl-D-erythritol 2,4-cyclodiphosphate synthase
VSAALIDRVITALNRADAVTPVLPVTDTLRRKTGDAFMPVARADLLRAQTPQGFRFDAILDAHRRFRRDPVTDDFALAECAGLSLATVMGDEMNMKITTPEDFVLAERIAAGILPDLRTATGYDAHRFGPGDHVWLCGVKIPHTQGLEGHSDADVGLHALTDAILGAIGEGDIGMHFPSSEQKWANKPSVMFLERAADLLRDRRGSVANADVTLICEAPKIGPHRQAMRELIARTLGIEIDRVSVKATTTDGLGFTGRAEGIAAQATVTVRLPA